MNSLGDVTGGTTAHAILGLGSSHGSITGGITASLIRHAELPISRRVALHFEMNGVANLNAICPRELIPATAQVSGALLPLRHRDVHDVSAARVPSSYQRHFGPEREQMFVNRRNGEEPESRDWNHLGEFNSFGRACKSLAEPRPIWGSRAGRGCCAFFLRRTHGNTGAGGPLVGIVGFVGLNLLALLEKFALVVLEPLGRGVARHLAGLKTPTFVSP
mmetsp:Transcript_135858/g.271019  ORF Transcript_135858/g.271019 Transcript_135858/m.271019 type:complete len:218 (+) Transcript_135858:884-1537(+)